MKVNLSSLVLLALFLSPQVFAKKQNAAPPVNPLIAYWNLDEVTDNKIMDQSGNGLNGTVTGGVLEEGKLGKAMLFTAANKNFVTVESSEKFNFPAKQFTIMAWIKPKTLTPAAGTVLKLVGAGGNFLQVNKDGLSYADGIQPNPCAFGAWGKLEQDKWQHVAAVRNGDRVTLYIDGREVGARIYSGELKPSKARLFIGNNPERSGFFDGWIDEVAIIGKALTPKDIMAKAQMGASK
jgi:hypothetical protein